MLTAFLARSGNRVLIPDAVGVLTGEEGDEVHFVDAEGRALAIFKRADVIVYSGDAEGLARASEAELRQNSRS
jgi:hypothetical protein